MGEPSPPATMTVTIDAPVLDDVFQSVRDFEAEVRDLRIDFTTRMEASEAQLANYPVAAQHRFRSTS
ncbi:hypothetical protein KCU78_g12621, partial [Aureobasidium melanogenum]